MTLYTAGHLHTAVPHCSHSRVPIVHTAVPRENNEHGCVYLPCRAVCKLPGCVEVTRDSAPDDGLAASFAREYVDKVLINASVADKLELYSATYFQETTYTNQFSVTKHQKTITGTLTGDSGLPGVFFMYELSPMMVKYTEKNR